MYLRGLRCMSLRFGKGSGTMHSVGLKVDPTQDQSAESGTPPLHNVRYQEWVWFMQ